MKGNRFTDKQITCSRRLAIGRLSGRLLPFDRSSDQAQLESVCRSRRGNQHAIATWYPFLRIVRAPRRRSVAT
jgi:hypothetical protein